MLAKTYYTGIEERPNKVFLNVNSVRKKVKVPNETFAPIITYKKISSIS